jgi:hypothetical protein
MKQFIIFLGASLLFFAVGLEANILPIVNSSSICTSKAPCELTWVEDGVAPKLLDLPPVNIKLMTGPNQNQIEVLDLGTVPAVNKKLVYNIKPDLGPPGKFYFYTFNVGLDEPIWSSRFTIQDVSGNIPGFDPNAVNAKGDIITSSSPSASATDSNSSPSAAASETSAASPILSVNAATVMGLSMAVMAVVYLG